MPTRPPAEAPCPATWRPGPRDPEGLARLHALCDADPDVTPATGKLVLWRSKFLWQDHEWDYPSQVFAVKGYVVLLVNEPRVAGGADPRDAVSTMESAVQDAVDRGEVDPNRVGIASYSRGAQITQRALAISTVFTAGSSGDGGTADPGGLGDEVGDRINAPLLAQSTEAVGVMLFPVIKRLRARGIPAEMVLFPDETHIFHQPRHREAAMRQNLDWFDSHLG